MKPDAMRAAAREGCATATDLADDLVRKGLALRDADEAVVSAVRTCAERDADLADRSLDELRSAMGPTASQIDADSHDAFTLEQSIAIRRHVGGPGPGAGLRRDRHASTSPARMT